jgi:hypothetical protein
MDSIVPIFVNNGLALREVAGEWVEFLARSRDGVLRLSDNLVAEGEAVS